MKHNIKLGICMDHFSDDFVSRKASLEELMRTSAKFGYQGVEFTPAQMIASYPDISDEDIDKIKGYLTKYHMEPFCWNNYLDTGMIPGRNLSENEIHKSVMQNLIYAKKAGFPLIKTTRAITSKIFRKMITLCRDLDMRLAIEIEAHDVKDGAFQEFIQIIDTYGEGYAGAMIDLGLLSMPTTDLKSLLKISFGIYMQPEQVRKKEEIIRQITDLGYRGYVLCRGECKYSSEAQTQAEQFIKSCNSVLENNYEIEK